MGAGPECSVCGDVGIPGTVLALGAEAGMATVQMPDEARAVAVDLLDDLKVGDVVLVHAGVAIARIDPGDVQASGSR